MARVRVELLVVLTGTLLLASVWGWERINETELLNFYSSGRWSEQETQTVTSPAPDDRSDYDEGEDEVEGTATGNNLDPFAGHGFQVDTEDSGPTNWPRGIDSEFQVDTGDSGPTNWPRGFDSGFHVETEDSGPTNWPRGFDGGFHVETEDSGPTNWPRGFGSGFQVDFVDTPSRSWTSGISPGSTGIDVVCSESGFQITLAAGSLSELKVLGSKDLVSVMGAPESCGYEVNVFRSTLTVPFTGCNVKRRDTDSYSLQLLYVDEFGQTQVATASCEQSPTSSGLDPRASGQTPSKCSGQTSKATNCAVSAGERLTCGQSGISSSDCEMMGCCFDSPACYYPMDECTGDEHFVFAVRANAVPAPADLSKLVIPADTSCKPIIVNDKVAIFKFKVTECGTRSYVVGETKIYLAEVQTTVKALNLKYGVVTRTDPIRFMVECRYGKTGTKPSPLASIGYMVKTPSSPIVPPSVQSNGLYAVQLLIAKDQTFSSYWPTYHQPLRMLLGKPVYLELFLKSPKPDAAILVNYCIAYPRSAKNALVLIYEGCANPYDPNVSVLKVSGLPKNRYQRRFVVNAFQFMDQKTNKYLDEEIYFMCSTEVCRSLEKKCEERCFDGKAP